MDCRGVLGPAFLVKASESLQSYGPARTKQASEGRTFLVSLLLSVTATFFLLVGLAEDIFLSSVEREGLSYYKGDSP